MNEIVKSQLRFLEAKLSTANDPERIAELEKKVKELKQRAKTGERTIVPKRVSQEVSTISIEERKKRRAERLAKRNASYEEEVIKEVVDKIVEKDIELPVEPKEEKPVELNLELETKTVKTETRKLAVPVENIPEIEEPEIVVDEEIVADLEKLIEAEKNETVPTVDEVEKEIEAEGEIEVPEEEKPDELRPKVSLSGVELDVVETTTTTPAPTTTTTTTEKKVETTTTTKKVSAPSGSVFKLPTEDAKPKKKKIGRPKGSKTKK